MKYHVTFTGSVEVSANDPEAAYDMARRILNGAGVVAIVDDIEEVED